MARVFRWEDWAVVGLRVFFPVLAVAAKCFRGVAVGLPLGSQDMRKGVLTNVTRVL